MSEYLRRAKDTCRDDSTEKDFVPTPAWVGKVHKIQSLQKKCFLKSNVVFQKEKFLGNYSLSYLWKGHETRYFLS